MKLVAYILSSICLLTAIISLIIAILNKTTSIIIISGNIIKKLIKLIIDK